MPDNNNIDVAIRIEEKFNFYFLGLTFVILGLSIQTSKVVIADVSEGIKEAEAKLSKLETKNNLKHRLHVHGFSIGLLLLMGSRGYEPAARLVGCLFKRQTTTSAGRDTKGLCWRSNRFWDSTEQEQLRSRTGSSCCRPHPRQNSAPEVWTL